jgi:hypothetical protein
VGKDDTFIGQRCSFGGEHTDYFINGKHIKDCVVNILKDVYFGV